MHYWDKAMRLCHRFSTSAKALATHGRTQKQKINSELD